MSTFQDSIRLSAWIQFTNTAFLVLLNSLKKGCNYFNSNIVKYYYNLKELLSILIYFKMQFIPVMQRCIFSVITLFFFEQKVL